MGLHGIVDRIKVMYMLVNIKMIRNMEKVHLHGIVDRIKVMYMLVNIKMVRNMEKVHLHIIVDRIKVRYMLVNIKMVREMDMVNTLMQMVLSIMMECGKMVNECMMNEIFQYTTKYNKSINPGWIKLQTVITNKHEKTKQNKNTGEGVKQTNKRSETFLHVYKSI